MMRQKSVDCLLTLGAELHTKENCLKRLENAHKQLRRVAGVLKSITPKRMQENTEYWKNVMDGWAGYLQLLSNELLLIQTKLLKELTE